MRKTGKLVSIELRQGRARGSARHLALRDSRVSSGIGVVRPESRVPAPAGLRAARAFRVFPSEESSRSWAGAGPCVVAFAKQRPWKGDPLRGDPRAVLMDEHLFRVQRDRREAWTWREAA